MHVLYATMDRLWGSKLFTPHMNCSSSVPSNSFVYALLQDPSNCDELCLANTPVPCRDTHGLYRQLQVKGLYLDSP